MCLPSSRFNVSLYWLNHFFYRAEHIDNFFGDSIILEEEEHIDTFYVDRIILGRGFLMVNIYQFSSTTYLKGCM